MRAVTATKSPKVPLLAGNGNWRAGHLVFYSNKLNLKDNYGRQGHAVIRKRAVVEAQRKQAHRNWPSQLTMKVSSASLNRSTNREKARQSLEAFQRGFSTDDRLAAVEKKLLV